MNIYRLVTILIVIYIIGTALTFLSEITYKGRTISEVRKDYKYIIKRSSLIFLILVFSSIIYYVLLAIK